MPSLKWFSMVDPVHVVWSWVVCPETHGMWAIQQFQGRANAHRLESLPNKSKPAWFDPPWLTSLDMLSDIRSPLVPSKTGLFWCQWHQVTSCHIVLLLVICRGGNNGGWRRGGPSAGDHPPIPWALRQVFLQTEYNSRKSWFATFTILMCNVHHSRISYMSLSPQTVTASEVWFYESKFFNRFLNYWFSSFRFMHTTVEGPVLWFRSKVEGARTGEVNF